jgi:hypothetical protein
MNPELGIAGGVCGSSCLTMNLELGIVRGVCGSSCLTMAMNLFSHHYFERSVHEKIRERCYG